MFLSDQDLENYNKYLKNDFNVKLNSNLYEIERLKILTELHRYPSKKLYDIERLNK